MSRTRGVPVGQGEALLQPRHKGQAAARRKCLQKQGGGRRGPGRLCTLLPPSFGASGSLPGLVLQAEGRRTPLRPSHAPTDCAGSALHVNAEKRRPNLSCLAPVDLSQVLSVISKFFFFFFFGGYILYRADFKSKREQFPPFFFP